MGTWHDIAAGGAGILGGVINSIGSNKREKRAFVGQHKLMDIQTDNQMKLNRQGQELQLDTWNKTNYGAQMEHLRDAGLNAGLMYGQAGAGGTTGGQGGGSASGGSAPSPAAMDIGAMQAAQIALMGAQKEKLESETNNTNKDTELKGAQEGSVIASTTWQELQNRIGQMTEQDAIQAIVAETDSKIHQAEIDGDRQEISNRRRPLRVGEQIKSKSKKF